MGRLGFFRKQLLERETLAEIKMEKILSDLFLNYEKQYIFAFENTGTNIIADFYIKGIRTIFEIDGNQHYYNSKIIRKDVRKEIELYQKHGIFTYRFKNNDILKHTDEVIKDIIVIIVKLSKRSKGKLFVGGSKLRKKRLDNILSRYLEIKKDAEITSDLTVGNCMCILNKIGIVQNI